MKFVLLYYYDPTKAGPTEAEVSQWIAFDQETKDANVFVYEAGFHPATTAQTISVRDDQVATEQGAVTSSGDVLAGFYIVDTTDAQAALDWAQRIPTAKYGKVEVRPIVDFS